MRTSGAAHAFFREFKVYNARGQAIAAGSRGSVKIAALSPGSMAEIVPIQNGELLQSLVVKYLPEKQ